MRSDYYNTERAFLADEMQAVMDQRSKLGATPLLIEVTFPVSRAPTPRSTRSRVANKALQQISDLDAGLLCLSNLI
jgi:hypothetical protein